MDPPQNTNKYNSKCILTFIKKMNIEIDECNNKILSLKQEISRQKIISAYYKLSLVYKENLNDLLNASLALEELLEKHPHNKYELQ